MYQNNNIIFSISYPEPMSDLPAVNEQLPAMSRGQKCRLRELTPEERAQLEQISRAHAVPARHVARAKALLAVAAQQNGVASAPLGASGLGSDAIAWAVPVPLWVCRLRRNRTGSYGDGQTKRPTSRVWLIGNVIAEGRIPSRN